MSWGTYINIGFPTSLVPFLDPFQPQLCRDSDQLVPKKPGAEKVLTAALHIIDPTSGKGPLAEHELFEQW